VNVCLHFGPKFTSRIIAKLYFNEAGYEFKLVPTGEDRLIFAEEMVLYDWKNERRKSLGAGHAETRLKDFADRKLLPDYVYEATSSWVVYHFHDTSVTAGVRRLGPINHNEDLHPDGGNLAAFLYRIKSTHLTNYERIRDVVRLAAPFFDDFKLRPDPLTEDQIRLEWLQKEWDYPFLAGQLSDGTLRFMCLATALLQPSPPQIMLFDEPELGLHPYALTLLANLFQQAAQQGRQVIVSTQSAQLLNEFAPEDVIVVERTGGESVFRRLRSGQLSEWIEEYTLGELWQKNVLGGGPRNEEIPLPSDGDGDASVAPQKEESSAGDERS
jgi:predicted ATPase